MEEEKAESAEKAEGVEIGRVTDFFVKVQAAAIELTGGDLKVGDTIKIKGHTTDLTQAVESMQIENQPIQEAKQGDLIGIKVNDRVRKHDIVYKL